MLTSHTSSEEKIPYLQKFAQNIRNNNERPQLLENTTSSPGSRPCQFFPSLPTPRTGLLIPLEKIFYSQYWRVLLLFLL